MITQDIDIKEINWKLRIFYCPQPNQVNYVLSWLFNHGCIGVNYRRAMCLLRSGAYNTGLTYTNNDTRTSIIVIGNSSNIGEFVNTLSHELNHFKEHVMSYLHIQDGGEDEAYFTGELCEIIYHDVVDKIFPCL